MDRNRSRRGDRVCDRDVVAGDHPLSPDDGDVTVPYVAGPLATRPRRTLVAGIGNIFQSDDGFGVEVVRRIRAGQFGSEVDVVDFGIRGVHLAYEIASGTYGTVVLVDAVRRGGPAGAVYAIEPDIAEASPADADAHDLNPSAVLAWVRAIGGCPSRIVIVGCEPASIDEGIGLSEPVASAIAPAIDLVRDLIAGEQVV